MTDVDVSEHWDEYDERGFVVFERVLGDDEVARYRAALEPHLTHRGRNDFEGTSTNRVYALLAKDPAFADMALHPIPLAFAERDLGPSFLLSAMLAINLHPGETVQPWHTDDGYAHVELPHPAFGVSAFWALDDTTATNGATEVLPGSHRWASFPGRGALSATSFAEGGPDDGPADAGTDDPGAHADAIAVTMPAGSLMVAKGTLWHRGGANRSDSPRLIVTPQYCAGWMRQIENMTAAIPRDVAAGLPPRLQELIGYSIHPPFIGYADGVHPAKLLPTR